ncbi:MAG: transposase [Planctomycetota bacterium]
MYFVGIDLHKKLIVLCVMDQNRRVMQTQKFACCEVGLIRKFFESLGKFRAVVEATASYEWLVDLLEPLADKIVLAHPSKLRVIAESSRKIDKLDAKILAEFLVLDMIPGRTGRRSAACEHRMLVRHRVSIRRAINRVKCRIRRVLFGSQHGSGQFVQRERTAICPNADLARIRAFRARSIAGKLRSLERTTRRYRSTNQAIPRKRPTKEKEARELLATVPGVGEVVTEVILAELGDVNRFGSQKKSLCLCGSGSLEARVSGKVEGLGHYQGGFCPPRGRCWCNPPGWPCGILGSGDEFTMICGDGAVPNVPSSPSPGVC